jgi:DNA primase
VPRYSEATLAAIKNGVDLVALVGDLGLPVTRSGSKFKALCPFHDDKNPSLELNPQRQSYKCWSCGAGGDVFDFVKDYLRVEFPEALRMLADRAGVVLERPAFELSATDESRASKSDLLGVNKWAEDLFIAQLKHAEGAKAYALGRGLSRESLERFGIGYAPSERGWLISQAKQAGYTTDLLEQAGLVSRPEDSPGLVRERFRGRLMFPIHDILGRTVGFGGRVLPEVERILAASGKNVAKYLNSPETPVFLKRRVLYASDLARTAAREAGWVAVVEGYTDVIAAHQVGLRNVVGTLGTALGDDHVVALRRLVDRVVLVFDGDDAGQSAADRALELFLQHEVDVRVLTLPAKLDPCDFLLKQGADAFRGLVEKAVDPLAFALRRAESLFDFRSPEGTRKAADWVLGILARVPASSKHGIDVKVAKALDTLSSRLRVPVETLDRQLRQLRSSTRKQARARKTAAAANAESSPTAPPPLRLADLDATDRALMEIVLNEPNSVNRVISRVAVASLRDEPLRKILQACYDLHGENLPPTFEHVARRLGEAERALAAGLLLPIDPAPFPDRVRPAAWEDRLGAILARLADRDRLDHLRNLKAAIAETSPLENPAAHVALSTEYRRLLIQRPDTKPSYAS